MQLVRIDDAAKRMGVSSRTLRYYEQAGLVQSVRPAGAQHRFYDAAAMERIAQILVLRRLQIPIKDIQRVYSRDGETALVDAFVRKLQGIDEEMVSLAELRGLVQQFMQGLQLGGDASAAALPRLYAEAQKGKTLAQTGPWDKVGQPAPVTVAGQGGPRIEAGTLPGAAYTNDDVGIIRLPPRRVLVSRRGDGSVEELTRAADAFEELGLVVTPGLREAFYLRCPQDVWLFIAALPPGFDAENTGYESRRFAGGLFATATCMAEDMDSAFARLHAWLAQSGHFAYDARCEDMVEELYPYDITAALGRWRQEVFVPIVYKQ